MFEDLTREEVLAAVDRAVTDLLAAAGVLAPPVDAVALAERPLGLTIRADSQVRRRVKVNQRKEVLLPPTASMEQTQAIVAYAIGAFLKPDILRSLGVPGDQAKGLMGVSLPSVFAERLLVPTAWLAVEARALDFDVPELHRRFSTAGPEVIAERLLDLEEPCIITIVDNGTVVRRRGNGWRVNRKLAAPEADCLRLVEESGSAHVQRADGWTVQGWPVARAAGQRVILRSVREEV